MMMSIEQEFQSRSRIVLGKNKYLLWHGKLKSKEAIESTPEIQCITLHYGLFNLSTVDGELDD